MINVPMLASLGVTVIVFGIAVLMVVETVALNNNQPPITTYTRRLVLRWPGRVLMVTHTLVFVVGALLAHFVWDATCG